MASFGAGLDYRLSENWHASLKYRFAKENRTNSDSLLFVSDAAGNYSNTLYAALTRYFYQNVDAMVQGQFNTGSIKHDVVIGAGYQSQVSEYDNSEGWNDGYFARRRQPVQQHAAHERRRAYRREPLPRSRCTTQTAVYASDTVQFNSRFSALLGVRYTQFRQHTYDPSGAVASQYDANPVTPTFALMFKTDPYSTLYASYVESLEQGGSASNTNVNFPQTFGPLRSKQYEVGFKSDHQKWGANLALFRVDQGYNYTNSANVFVQDGTKRYTGVDASGWVQLASEWRVLGGVMWLDTKAVDVDDPSDRRQARLRRAALHGDGPGRIQPVVSASADACVRRQVRQQHGRRCREHAVRAGLCHVRPERPLRHADRRQGRDVARGHQQPVQPPLLDDGMGLLRPAVGDAHGCGERYVAVLMPGVWRFDDATDAFGDLRMRPVFVRLHRWFGIGIALFLFVSGVTGAVIAWNRELDAALNPEFYYARTHAPALLPLDIANRVEAADPRLHITYLPLGVEPGSTLQVRVEGRLDPATQAPYELGFNQLAIDPATGIVQARREWGALSVTRLNLMPFLYQFHYTLYLPTTASGIAIGVWLLGIVGIVWLFDSVIALVLAFPSPKTWRKSLMFRVRRGGYALVFDLHRSGGVWVWAMLGMIALTSISMNLEKPVMRPVVSFFSTLAPTPESMAQPARPGAARLSRERIVELAAIAGRKMKLESPPARRSKWPRSISMAWAISSPAVTTTFAASAMRGPTGTPRPGNRSAAAFLAAARRAISSCNPSFRCTRDGSSVCRGELRSASWG